MPFFDFYPYSNLHNVNLDWILQRVKEWGEMVERNNQNFLDLQSANESFKEYVTNYLVNLNVQEEIDDKLDRMLESGVLTSYIQPYVSSATSAWLDGNITQPVGVVIDTSLTVQGACADAKVVGDKFISDDYTILSNTNFKTFATNVFSETIAIQMEQGAFSRSDGSNLASTKSLRSFGYVNNTSYLECNNGYKFAVWRWNRDNVFSGHLQSNGLYGNDTSYKFVTNFYFDGDYNYKITLYKEDNTEDIGINDDFTIKCLNASYYNFDDILIKFERPDFESGSFRYTSGLPFDTTHGIRSTTFLDRSIIKIDCDDSHKMTIWAWDIEGNYIGHLQNNGMFGNDSSYMFLRSYFINAEYNYSYKIVIYNNDTTIDISPNNVSYFNTYTIANTNTDVNLLSLPEIINFRNTTEIFANNTSVGSTDNGLLNSVCVVKYNNLYYMYYEAYSNSDSITYANASLCFAYSTDGLNFIKSFPSGINPPFENSNRIFPKGANHGACVCVVNDTVYPFRMFGVIATDNNKPVKMWRSSDGANFEEVTTISNGYNDSFISCVVKGNLIKLFLRTRTTNGRAIGIVNVDYDGNIIFNKWSGIISNNDINNQFYQASASRFNDSKEILLPTVYNPITSEETVNCLILSDDNCKKIEIDTDTFITNDVKSIYFGNIVSVGLQTFAYYTIRDTDHEHTSSNTVSKIMRVEIYDNTYPNIVRP